MRLLFCFVLVGCGSVPPSLEVAMEPDAEVPIWRGPQGGYHLDVRLRPAHFDARGARLRITGTRADAAGTEVCAASYPGAALDPAYGEWRCFFFDEPALLVGSAVEVSATAEDASGLAVSDACRLTLGEIRTIF